MIVPLLLGAGLGLGLLLLQRALLPSRPRLADALDRLERLTPGAEFAAGGWRAGVEQRAAGWIGAIGINGRLTRNLRLLDRTPQQHAVAKLTGALLGLAYPAVLAAVLSLAGVRLPLAGIIAAAAIGAPLGFLLPDRRVIEHAEQRRASFRAALASYLDLVTILLAGGGHMETALVVAARTGDGWSFAELRRALEVARVHRESPWVTMARLGEELGVPELRELAASVQLAGSQGARAADSLASKAATLRAHQLAEAEAEAQRSTEQMTVPTTILVIGFVGFLLYPAIVLIAGTR